MAARAAACRGALMDDARAFLRRKVKVAAGK